MNICNANMVPASLNFLFFAPFLPRNLYTLFASWEHQMENVALAQEQTYVT